MSVEVTWQKQGDPLWSPIMDSLRVVLRVATYYQKINQHCKEIFQKKSERKPTKLHKRTFNTHLDNLLKNFFWK